MKKVSESVEHKYILLVLDAWMLDDEACVKFESPRNHRIQLYYTSPIVYVLDTKIMHQYSYSWEQTLKNHDHIF